MAEEPETLLLKLKNDKVWDEPHWQIIAHEKDCPEDCHEKDDPFDCEIYFYVEDDVDFSKIKVGDKITLDEEFEVVDRQ
jgi:hypothetical protein